jgi:DNA-binding transcriptional MerR regulator
VRRPLLQPVDKTALLVLYCAPAAEFRGRLSYLAQGSRGLTQLESSNGLSLANIAAKVTFSTEQVARMCGVSRRQLAYWTQKGMIPCGDGYSLATIEKALLLRRELDRGRTLKGAVQVIERRLAERARFENMVAELRADSADGLCRTQLQKTADLLRQLRERVGLIELGERRAVTDQVAGMRLERLLHDGATAMPQNELLLCLYQANEHLDSILSDLPKAI